jgi:hypothetical protein
MTKTIPAAGRMLTVTSRLREPVAFLSPSGLTIYQIPDEKSGSKNWGPDNFDRPPSTGPLSLWFSTVPTRRLAGSFWSSLGVVSS